MRWDKTIKEGDEFVGVYEHYTFENLDLEIWLYDDEAEYRSGKKHSHYDTVFFRDESERISRFIKEVGMVLAQAPQSR